MKLAIDYYHITETDENEYSHFGTIPFIVNKILESEYAEHQWCVMLNGEILATSVDYYRVKHELDRIWAI